VGRVLYVRIHARLEGRRRTLGELRAEVEEIEQAIAGTPGSDCVVARLTRFEHALLDRSAALPVRVGRRLGSRLAGWRAVRDVRRMLRRDRRRTPDRAALERATLAAARRYVRGVRAVAGFETWEHLFAFWHVAHLPLSFLMYATAAVHVVAVHLY